MFQIYQLNLKKKLHPKVNTDLVSEQFKFSYSSFRFQQNDMSILTVRYFLNKQMRTYEYFHLNSLQVITVLTK